MFSSLPSRLFAALALVSATSVASEPDVSIALQNILNQAHQAPLYTYPTSLTQGIVPKGIQY